MIKYHYIKWKNTLSTGNIFTEVRLDKNPTTLIVGRNGHGKSTMLDALCFACFGKPFRDINLPNLINSINGKEMVTEVGFSSGPITYRIVRGMAPKVFEIYRNDILVPQDAAGGDYQTWLEDSVFKFNYKAFTQIVILGSKSFTPFMKLKSADRRNIIENLLDIEIFSAMSKVASEQAKKCKEDVAANKVKIDGLMSQVELHRKHKEDAEKNNLEIIKKYEQDILNFIQIRDEYTTQLNLETEMILANKDDINDITKDNTVSSFESLEIRVSSKIESLKKELQFFELHDNCPTCTQQLDNNFKNEKIVNLKNDIKRRSTGLEELQKQITIIKVHEKTIERSLAAKNHLQYQISQTADSIQDYRKKIVELENKKVLSAEMIVISDKLIADLQESTDERKVLVENKAYYDAAVALLKDGGVKAEIIRQYLPIINAQINKNLAAMDFHVSFELDEEFDETIKSRHRDNFSYSSFSEGEKQKIDLALLFAWRAVAKMKNSVNTNLLIMDEIFDSSMDGSGVDLVMSNLSSASEGSNIFIISHRELLQDRFTSIIRFDKHNNFSTMTQEQ